MSVRPQVNRGTAALLGPKCESPGVFRQCGPTKWVFFVPLRRDGDMACLLNAVVSFCFSKRGQNPKSNAVSSAVSLTTGDWIVVLTVAS